MKNRHSDTLKFEGLALMYFSMILILCYYKSSFFIAISILENGKAHGVLMNFAVMKSQSKDDLSQCTNSIRHVGCIDEGGFYLLKIQIVLVYK